MTQRIITTVSEVRQLKRWDIVRSHGGIAWQLDNDAWYMAGDSNGYIAEAIALPAIVLWESQP